MTVALTCPACGDNRFSFPPDGTDDSSVVCEECGQEVGTLGALKEEVARAVLQQDG